MADGSRKGAKTTFHLLAGLSSGVLSAVLLQPIDLLKTRVQQAGHHSLRRVLAELRASAQTPALSSSKPSHPRSFAASLYRGTLPSALRTGLGSALYFSGLNAIRSSAARVPVLASKSSGAADASSGPGSSSLVRLSNTGNMLAGAVARGAAGFVLMPLTIIKVRYESNLYNYRSLGSAAADIARTEGLRGFFAGFGATALRDAPYAGLYVLLYEQVKRRLSRAVSAEGHMSSTAAAAVHFSSAIVAATSCSVVSNPFDAIKTRIQLQPTRYRNMLQTARRMLHEEGVRSMWDGLGLRMSRKAMSSALAWTVYEELIRRAERHWG